jgi:hypothetical protein
VSFLTLTPPQAALFTAIVTSFVLDAMSDLDEDNTAKLLRVVIKQNMITNPAIEIPPPNPPPSIITVNGLWLLSIVSSLAATTWAILSLQWCTFLSDGVQAEDYEEMVEKRQRRFEAVKRWRVHFVVAAIPFFLHLSLFLFLAGLWLRLRDMNKQLGLIVGVPSLVIASSYVVMSLLPIFTNAPFFTSVSEIAQPVVDEIRHIGKLSRFIRPPPIFSLIRGAYPLLIFVVMTFLSFLTLVPVTGFPQLGVTMGVLGLVGFYGVLLIPGALEILGVFRIPDIFRIPAGGSTRTLISLGIFSYFPRVKTHHLTAFPKLIYRIAKRCIYALWKIIALLLPTFGPDQNPFDELNKLKVGRSDRGGGVHLRALTWLMNTKTPLSKDEVKEILKEFRDRRNPGEHLDDTNIRLFVLSLSSFLGDDHISDGERPIFDYCTTTLAEGMDRAFGNGEYSQRALFRNTIVSKKLSPHFRLTTPNEGGSGGHPTTDDGEEYWARAIPALWLCPSTETIRSVTNQLNSDIQSMEASRLQRIIRGLHAATLVCFNLGQITFESIPDFSLRSWGPRSSNWDLDKDLSAFFKSLFAAFYTTLQRSDNPITTPSLIVDCLNVFDSQPELSTPKLDSALCFFVAVMWRTNPEVFKKGPSVADALLKSAGSYRNGYRGESNPKRATMLANRLRAVAYGPKQIISWKSCTLQSLGELYAGLPDSVKTDPQCLKGFLEANAAILEAAFAVDRHFQIILWQRSPDYRTMRNIFTDSLFTHDALFDFVRENPEYRLPYLYSLAITLSYTTEGRNQKLWKVADLFVARDEEKRAKIKGVLTTNILVVAVLRFALHDRPETVEQERKGRLLESLESIAVDGTGRWGRWTSIYLIADLVQLLSQIDGQYREHEQTKSLIGAANKSLEEGELGRVPSDWETKREGLALCELETKVRGLIRERGKEDVGVYKWHRRGNLPYLSMYNVRAPTGPVSAAVYEVAAMFQR